MCRTPRSGRASRRGRSPPASCAVAARPPALPRPQSRFRRSCSCPPQSNRRPASAPVSASWRAKAESPAANPGGPAHTSGRRGLWAQTLPRRSACSESPPPPRESTPGWVGRCGCQRAAPAARVRGWPRKLPSAVTRRVRGARALPDCPARKSPQAKAIQPPAPRRPRAAAPNVIAIEMQESRQENYRRC